MVIDSFSDVIFSLLFFSVVGWIGETILHLIHYKKFVNKGFLFGPYSPMYGFAGLILILFKMILPVPFLLFFLFAFLFFIFYEYTGNLVLEKLTNIQWWNYDGRKLQFRGRVYFPYAFFYALVFSCLIFYGGPIFGLLFGNTPSAVLRLISSGIIIVIITDQYFSLKNLADFHDRLTDWKKLYAKLDEEGKCQLVQIKNKTEFDQFPPEIREEINTITEKEHSGYRLFKSYPDMKIKDDGESITILKDLLQRDKDRWVERGWIKTKTKSKRFIESAKQDARELTGGLNFSKVFWIFLICGIFGYVVETLFALVTRGVLESRQGVIYGPFNQVYAFGGLIIVLALLPLVKKKTIIIFIGSAIIGGAFEWVCSFIQEKIFGTVSWQYKGQIFAIGKEGRTALLPMIFWGILGVLFMKFVLPRFLKLINRIARKQNRFVTWILVVFIIFDMAISAVAVYRWGERQDGIEAKNRLELFLDKHYPDNLLKEIYPNMRDPNDF
ncbi:putative ABC transporter permease [Breznakiella homolactica]|uniref:Putative ABC transporter permease n=1 Tax=Breznakiella homolactica TaxID=2798577 RepID=A0A7T7XNL3_9SPIR|nr:putative ABC transporter permease [Breznakiella homolactica]QQO09552.1 putative ABC transporter permease [Breznakiella homolactica]